jgi:hypothetical protein
LADAGVRETGRRSLKVTAYATTIVTRQRSSAPHADPQSISVDSRAVPRPTARNEPVIDTPAVYLESNVCRNLESDTSKGALRPEEPSARLTEIFVPWWTWNVR